MCSLRNKFAVVVFPDEDVVEVVSTNWLAESSTTCYWPSTWGKKLTKCLKEHLDPINDTQHQWQIFNCRHLGTYETFELANEKRKKGECTSNLDTSAAEDTPTTRRPTRTSKIPKRSLNVPSTSINFTAVGSPKSPSSSSSSSPEPQNRKITTGGFRLQHPTLGLVQSNPISSDTSVLFKSLPPLNPQKELRPLCLPVRNDPGEGTSAALLKTILSLKTDFQNQNENNKRFQEVVLSQLLTINNGIKKLLQQSEKQSANGLEDISFQLPVSSLTQFAELKTWIETEPNYKNTLPHLTVLGGTNPKAITHNILAALFTASVAEQLSFTGTGTTAKDGMKGSKLLELVNEAVRRTNGGATTTNSEIKEFIKAFFKNSSDKKGGRERRKLQKTLTTGANLQDEDLQENNTTSS